MAAATRARRFDPGSQITVFEASREFSRSTCALPYYVSAEVSTSKEMFATSLATLESMGIELRLEAPVSEIDSRARQIISGGRSFPYDRLVVTTGACPRTVPVLTRDSEKERLWRLESLADADFIRRSFARLRPRSVAVIGGGYLGLEMAEVFSLMGAAVTIFHRHSTVMRLWPGGHQAVVSLLGGRGVTVRTDCEVKLIDPASRHATVEYCNAQGERQSEGFEAVFLAPGVIPNATLLRTAGAHLGPLGGVRISARGETSLPNIYAAGDGVELPNPNGGGSRHVPLASNAARWGRVCGENAAGGSLRGPDPWGCVAVRLFDSQVASVGYPEAEIETSGYPTEAITVEMPGRAPFARRASALAHFLFQPRSERLIGAQFVGPQAAAWADLGAMALLKGMRISELAEFVPSYTPPLSSLWHPFVLLARIAEKSKGEQVWR